MELKGEKITLVPIQPEEKDEFYKLATESYGGTFWFDKEQKSKLTKEKFFQDWNEHYFNINSPEKGQCFWIILDKERIGQINYSPIDTQNKRVELDIVIGAEENLDKGYGSDALKALIKHLFDSFDINKVWIMARANNPRAIKACEKVGLQREGLLREESFFNGEFVDCVRFAILKPEFM